MRLDGNKYIQFNSIHNLVETFGRPLLKFQGRRPSGSGPDPDAALGIVSAILQLSGPLFTIKLELL